MKSKIAKWGSALGIRIPREMARSLNILPGDSMEISLVGESLTLTPIRDNEDLATLLGKVTPENKHGETDWGVDTGNERH